MGRRRSRSVREFITASAADFARFILEELEREFLRTDQAQGRRRPHAVAPPSPSSAYGPYSLLGVLPSAPREVVEAAYRALALKYHPDRIGHIGRVEGAEIMVKLNQAIEHIRRERGWK